jgi:hypothetical protein
MLGLARCPRLCLSHPRSMPPAARLTATPLNGSVAHLPQALPPEHHGCRAIGGHGDGHVAEAANHREDLRIQMNGGRAWIRTRDRGVMSPLL